ncbi:hypothetical protein D3C76_1356400 [compost metagenome]
MHDGIGCLGLLGEDVGVIQGAQHWSDAQGLQGLAFGRIADQAGDLVSGVCQVLGYRATDVARSAGYEDFHRGPFLLVVEGSNLDCGPTVRTCRRRDQSLTTHNSCDVDSYQHLLNCICTGSEYGCRADS